MADFEKILAFSGGNIRQFLILVRHFFHRLFLNDVVSFEEQMKEKVIGILAFIAVFCGHLSNSLLFKYLFLEDKGDSWVEKCYYITFFMVIMGFVSILEWNVIFPDSRDYSNLMPLPIKTKTLFTAKFTSLCIFIGMFTVGANVISTFMFWLYLARWQSSSPFFGIRFVIVHLTSVFAAGFFIFFLSILLIGILMNILGPMIFRSISVFIRVFFMVVFVSLFIFFLSESLTVSHALSILSKFKESNSLFIYLFPPMWFTGLYESLLGNSDSFYSLLSRISILGVIISIGAFFITAAIGYRRYIKRMPEAKKRTVHLQKLKSIFFNVFNSLFLRNSTQRAIFDFFRKALRGSILHKIRLAPYLAVPAGVILIILTSKMNNSEFFYQINKTLLSIPLVLSFFLLVGVRVIVSIPLSLDSNWIFKLTEIKNKKHYFLGLRKGVFFLILLPLFILFFVFYLYLWGWQNASLHCLYGLSMSILVMEVLFMNYQKIPFACSYLPGKAKIHVLWFVYVLSFLVYIYLFTYFEYKLLKSPSNFLIFYGVILFLFLSIRIYQHYLLYKKTEIIYEEKPEPVMVTLVAYDSL